MQHDWIITREGCYAITIGKEVMRDGVPGVGKPSSSYGLHRPLPAMRLQLSGRRLKGGGDINQSRRFY